MSAIFTLRAHSVVAAILLLAGAALVAPPARAQSLADVARKEEDRRKTVREPAKVYTNKDLNPAAAGSPPPPSAAKTGDAAAKDADGDAKAKTAKADAGKEKDQAYWAGRLKTLQDTLARDQNYADAMQTRVNALNTEFLARDDPAQRAVIGRDRLKAVAELEKLTKAVQDEKKAVADFMEEARQAGVPPGWLR